MIRLKYFDSIRHLLRSGQASDPYVLKITNEKIVNNKLSLDEIPDPMYHVRITGYTELDKSVYYVTKTIPSNKFYVEYDNGVIYFNPSEDGKTVGIEYKGRGVLQFPAERIWVHSPNPWAVDNLQEFVDFLIEKTKEFIKLVEDKEQQFTTFINEKVEYVTNFVEAKKQEFTDFVDAKAQYVTEFVTAKTLEFKAYIDGYIFLADKKIEEMDRHIVASDAQTDSCREQTEECKVETNKAILATNESIVATDKSTALYDLSSILYADMSLELVRAEEELEELIKAKLATRLIMQSPVDTLASIALTYPNPEIGWAVQAEDTGNIYRWNGVHWMYAYNLQATIAPATETMNGLMTTDHVNKLNNIEEKAQVNYIGEQAKNVLPTYFKTKTAVFILADDLSVGSQGIYIQMPFDGRILDIRGFCKTTGSTNTVLKIEKASEGDFLTDTWTSIFDIDGSLIIPTNSKVSMAYTLINTTITRNDYLRVNIIDIGEGIRDITIQVNIEI